MVKTITYKQSEHFKLQADFYASNEQSAPVILNIHGGGLLFGTRKDINEELLHLYLENGFSVLSIDYRLAPETPLSGILEDLRDAISWIITEGANVFSIDPQNIAVVGSSAGGFLALFTGTFPVKPKAIVSFYGYGDISAKWATTPSKFYCQKDPVSKEIANHLITDTVLTEASVEERFLLYVHARQTGEWIQTVTGVPIHHPDALKSLSPMHLVDTDYPPTLLLHGTSDSDVPYEQSVFMRGALVKKEVPVKLITIPNGEHVFDQDIHNPLVQQAFTQVIEFLHTHCK